jgi:hypothetical protein
VEAADSNIIAETSHVHDLCKHVWRLERLPGGPLLATHQAIGLSWGAGVNYRERVCMCIGELSEFVGGAVTAELLHQVSGCYRWPTQVAASISGAAAVSAEAWFKAAVELFRPQFIARGVPLPERIRVSRGWPRHQCAAGECWGNRHSADGHFEIFISPEVDDMTDVLDLLAHELAHAAVGFECGHDGPFRELQQEWGFSVAWRPHGSLLDLLRARFKARFADTFCLPVFPCGRLKNPLP